MAKGTAICTCAKCGGTFKVESIRCNRADADSWEAWAARNYTECKACYAARKAAERAAKDAEASARAREQGLPELSGSPKQIAWANTLRHTMLEQLADYSKRDGDGDEWHDFIAWVVSEYTAAKYWIERRGKNVYGFISREIPIYNERKGEARL